MRRKLRPGGGGPQGARKARDAVSHSHYARSHYTLSHCAHSHYTYSH